MIKPKKSYTLSRPALDQRRAAAAARSAANPRREFATVRIERPIRDAAGRCLRDGESLAEFVGAATEREIKRRRT